MTDRARRRRTAASVSSGRGGRSRRSAARRRRRRPGPEPARRPAEEPAAAGDEHAAVGPEVGHDACWPTGEPGHLPATGVVPSRSRPMRDSSDDASDIAATLAGGRHTSSSAGTACPAARRVAALGAVDALAPTRRRRAGRRGGPPSTPSRRDAVRARRSPVRRLPLPRPLLYETWHALRWPPVERATGPVDVVHATARRHPAAGRRRWWSPCTTSRSSHDPRTSPATGCGSSAGASSWPGAEADLVAVPVGGDDRRLRGRRASSPSGSGSCRGREPTPRRRRARWPRPRGRTASTGRYVLFVGTIEPRKNLPRLLEAFAGAWRPTTSTWCSSVRRAGTRSSAARRPRWRRAAHARLRARPPSCAPSTPGRVVLLPEPARGLRPAGARGDGAGHAGGDLGRHRHRGGRRRRRRARRPR